MRIQKKDNRIYIKATYWEVEAKREFLNKGSWAVIVNGKFIGREKAKDGIEAILTCFEVPAYIRNAIKEEISRREKYGR